MSVLPGLESVSEVRDLLINPNAPHYLTIPQGSQWKIKLTNDAKLTVRVISGIAEIFGTELATDVEYHFQNWCFSIFAVEETYIEWKSADLQQDDVRQDIQPNLTAHILYNLHFTLEKIRYSSYTGPRVMIIGEKNSGKTSLARTLCSYANKDRAYQPLYINLDPTNAVFSPPGCLTATPVSDILDPQLAIWGQSMTSGATEFHPKQPLVKNYGLETIAQNLDYYTHVMKQLARSVAERFQADPIVQRSGCIIDTPPLSSLSETLNELLLGISEFGVTFVVLLADTFDDKGEDGKEEVQGGEGGGGDNRVISETSEEVGLESEERKSSAKDLVNKVEKILRPYVGDFLVKIPRLSGRIDVDDVYMRAQQRVAIREYFYGNTRTVLSPYSVGVDFNFFTIWKPQTMEEANSSGLSSTALVPVEINKSNLQHALIAITYADRKAKMEEVMEAPILGYALITDVNEKRMKLKILVPVPGAFPNNATILTEYRYLE